jgi:hypothetical protein
VFVCVDQGDILTFSENGDFRGALASPCEGHIETIVPYSKGFICGMPEVYTTFNHVLEFN